MNTLNKNLTFQTKQEYLAYRAKWKSDYEELSQKIKDYKFYVWNTSLKLPTRITEENNNRAKEIFSKYGSRCYYILPLKKQATAMLEERKASKILAGEQYQSAKLNN